LGWLSVWSEVQTCCQLMPLPLTVFCFSKIRTGFTFLVLAHLGSPGQCRQFQSGDCCLCSHCLTSSTGRVSTTYRCRRCSRLSAVCWRRVVTSMPATSRVRRRQMKPRRCGLVMAVSRPRHADYHLTPPRDVLT